MNETYITTNNKPSRSVRPKWPVTLEYYKARRDQMSDIMRPKLLEPISDAQHTECNHQSRSDNKRDSKHGNEEEATQPPIRNTRNTRKESPKAYHSPVIGR